MSTTRISLTVGGMRLTFVRMRSSSRTATSRGQERHLDRAIGLELGVDELLDAWTEALGEGVELEVHARGQGLHVPSRDRNSPFVPDDPAQHMQRGVGAHQRMTPLPIHLGLDDVTNDRGRPVHRVPHHTVVLAHVGDGCGTEPPGVMGLASAGRIEGASVERNGTVTHRGHGGREPAEVRVAEVEGFGLRGLVHGPRSCPVPTL